MLLRARDGQQPALLVLETPVKASACLHLQAEVATRAAAGMARAAEIAVDKITPVHTGAEGIAVTPTTSEDMQGGGATMAVFPGGQAAVVSSYTQSPAPAGMLLAALTGGTAMTLHTPLQQRAVQLMTLEEEAVMMAGSMP